MRGAPDMPETISGAEMRRKGTPHSCATACASAVLPQPGGPCSSTPRGGSTPRCRYTCRARMQCGPLHVEPPSHAVVLAFRSALRKAQQRMLAQHVVV